jgi:ribose transport system ATP-binding protein
MFSSMEEASSAQSKTKRGRYMQEDHPLLIMRSISKSFPGVKALDNVNFEAKAREIHCLVGENGAGKSTLMKVLSGVYQADSGEIFIEGNLVRITDPLQGRKLRISILYQELDLVPSLSVAENVFLGIEPRTNTGGVDWRKLRQGARDMLASLSVDLDTRVPVKSLSVPQQQLVAIAKALSFESKILIMDEPSAVLSGRELDILFDIIRKLKMKNLAIIYISHRLEEIFQLGDRVTVLRDGRSVGTLMLDHATPGLVIQLMVGRDLGNYLTRSKSSPGDGVLRVRNLTRKGYFYDISFELRRGEILGIAGLVGAGRSEVARAIVAADPREKGDVFVEGIPVDLKSPGEALKVGIGLIPEDRKRDGLVLCRSIQDNISYTVFEKVARFSFINFRKLREIVRSFVRQLSIRTPSISHRVDNLSGGNQQKVVLAKWLARKCKVLILDEPTRGIDVGSKAEFYRLISKLASDGLGLILISSELPEILALTDRVLVMAEGRITKEFQTDEATQERVLEYAIPGNRGQGSS